MEFTKKIKSFVQATRQSTRSPSSPSDAALPSEITAESSSQKEKEESHDCASDPQIEEQILESIEELYYDNSVDSSDYELKKLPDIPDKIQIDTDRQRLQRQLHVVSKKVSDLILQNQLAYAQELQRVTDLQKNLDLASIICSEGRSFLSWAKKDFTTASLGILASYRKREQLRNLLRSLYMIKTLQETDVRLRELLEEEDYPGAIQLCLECQKAASTFGHYKCITELRSKLQDTLEMTEEQLDVALSSVCTKFDKTHYEKLQAAYHLLGKTQTAMDQLLMHFASAIHNKAFNIVLGYVELCSGGMETNFQKRQYADLCKHVSMENFTLCLTDLSKELWEVMCSYWCILEWHNHQDSSSAVTEQGDTNKTNVPDDGFSRKYVRQKLEHGLIRVWQDVQQKVKSYILASDLSSFKFDEFIHVLDLVRRLMDIGEEFCGSKSEDLQESLRKQSVNYFRNYHRSCMEELRMFLENESWALCPVRATFSTVQLQEFRFLRNVLGSRVLTSPCSSPVNSKLEKTCNNVSIASHQTLSYFKKFCPKGNPFEIQVEEEEGEDVLALEMNEDSNNCKSTYDSESDDSDVPEELKKDYVDENTDETPSKKHSKSLKKQNYISRKKQASIITNTTLNVLRLFGKYMQMMNVLKPIAFDVLICMSQLFDYYMYSVYTFFAKEMSDLAETVLSNKLRTTLRRIRDNLIIENLEMESLESRNKDKVPTPSLSPLVNLKNAEHLFGLAERVAAAESLIFLADQFEFLHPHLEAMIPGPKRAFLQQFCSQTISTAIELRRPVYMSVATKAVDYEQVLSLMGLVKWDIHEIMSQHSYYVDILLRELQVFSMRLSEVSKRVPLPKETSDLLWEHCIRLVNRTFIEGFSQAKKCTNEGRALMQLDYQQFLSKVERIMDMRPVPERELVESYIKAYYLLEPALEQWIRSHKEYSSKQLIGLVTCVTQLNKKAKQKLINLIEEGDRGRR